MHIIKRLQIISFLWFGASSALFRLGSSSGWLLLLLWRLRASLRLAGLGWRTSGCRGGSARTAAARSGSLLLHRSDSGGSRGGCCCLLGECASGAGQRQRRRGLQREQLPSSVRAPVRDGVRREEARLPCITSKRAHHSV